MKKSQMEILGLTIIVVLLIVVMLFVIQSVYFKKPLNIKKAYSNKEIASNIINAMILSMTECSGLTFTELFQDCANNYDSSNFSKSGNELCPSERSCQYLKRNVGSILNSTLEEKRKIKYYFEADYNGETLFDLGNKCPGGRTPTIQPLPIGTTGANIELRIYICT